MNLSKLHKIDIQGQIKKNLTNKTCKMNNI